MSSDPVSGFELPDIKASTPVSQRIAPCLATHPIQMPSGATCSSQSVNIQQDTSSSSQLLHAPLNKFFEKAKIRCPLCNQKFPASEIEQHADLCLINSEDPFVGIDEEDMLYLGSDNDHDQYLNLTEGTDGKDARGLIQLLINSCNCPKSESVCNFHVRRSYAFDDAFKFFKRPWNKEKKEEKLVVTFVGEAGVDTGGPLREFFSR